MSSMDAAYSVEAWKDFAVMIGGASAALAGLLIVSMSINIDEIVKFPHLPPRAAAALIALLSPLIIAIILLVPGQPEVAVGVELLALGLILGWVMFGRLVRFQHQQSVPLWVWISSTGGPMFVLVAGVLLAGVGMCSGTIGGLLWLAPVVIAAVLGGTAQAWVLLIEIRR